MSALPPIWQLANNLACLFQAAENDPPTKTEENFSIEEMTTGLYPNILWKGHTLNYKGIHQVYYAVVRWLDRFVCLLSGRKKDRVTLAVERIFSEIQELNKAYLKELTTNHLVTYQAYLKEACGIRSSKENKIDQATEAIKEYYLATRKFFFIEARQYPRIAAFIKKFFHKEDFKNSLLIERYYNEINLRAQLNETPPYSLIIQLAKNSLLEESDLSKWDKFVEQLVKSSITDEVLHQGLKAILDHASEYHMTQAEIEDNRLPDLYLLERRIVETVYKLIEANIILDRKRLFEKSTPCHAAWRSSLKEGSVLTSQEIVREGPKLYAICHKISLGEQVGKKIKKTAQSSDNHIFFEIKEYYISARREITEGFELEDIVGSFSIAMVKQQAEEQLVWIGSNPSTIGIVQTYRPSDDEDANDPQALELPLPDIEFIDPQGRFAVIEKLKESVGGTNWKEKMQEKEYQAPLIEFLKHLNKENYLVTPFEPHYFMFDKEGVLNCTRVTQKIEYSLAEFETFVFKLAEGEVNIFQTFLRESGFYEHEQAVIIEKIVKKLFDKDFNYDKEIKLNQVEGVLKEELIKLLKDLEALYERCYLQLALTMPTQLTETQSNKIKEKILYFYQQSGARTHVWPDLQDKVVLALRS